MGNGVAKFQADVWLSWKRACLVQQLSGFESRHLSKIKKMGDISKGVANTLNPPKKYTKK
jgi:hypothetical protein